MQTDRPLIIITRETRLAGLIKKFNTIDQARFYIEHLGANFADYEAEHEQYSQALDACKKAVQAFGRVQVLERTFLPNFSFEPDAVVIVLGQDGLVANTMKYLNNQPLLGINPAPRRYDGVLLPFTVGDLTSILPDVLQDLRAAHSISMACCELNDGQSLLAVNDLFIGPKSHTSAWYDIQFDGQQERQSSSGMIISTGLGSTGWFRSVLTGSRTIAGGETKVRKTLRQEGFAWDAPYLYYTVREPFPSQTSSTDLIFGQINQQQPLQVTSKMPEKGVIFSDGIESDYLSFTAGMQAKVTVADSTGQLII